MKAVPKDGGAAVVLGVPLLWWVKYAYTQDMHINKCSRGFSNVIDEVTIVVHLKVVIIAVVNVFSIV